MAWGAWAKWNSWGADAPTELSGSSGIAFDATAVFAGELFLTGASSLIFDSQIAVTAGQALIGSSGIAFDATTVFAGELFLTGSASLLFNSQIELNVGQALAGVSDIAFDASAVFLNTHTLTGSASVQFSSAMTLAVPFLTTDYFNIVHINAYLTKQKTKSIISGRLFKNRVCKLYITIDDGDLSASVFSSVVFGLYGLAAKTADFTKTLGNGIVIEGNAFVVTLNATDLTRVGQAYIGLKTVGAGEIQLLSDYIYINDTRL